MIRAVLVVAVLLAAAGGCGTPDRGSGPPGPDRDQALITAAAAGDAGRVRDLLAAGASPAGRDSGGATALVQAAYGNHLAAAEALIAAGADVNVADRSQQSAYLIATSEVGDDPRLLELTLRAGADVNAKDRFNGTGLIRAAERGHAVIVDRLIRAGIDRDHVNRLGYTALHEAIIFGDGGPVYVSTVTALVRGGVDVNLPTGDGAPPLALAHGKGFPRIAEILQAAGARG